MAVCALFLLFLPSGKDAALGICRELGSKMIAFDINNIDGLSCGYCLRIKENKEVDEGEVIELSP
ncbi:hypothetical protein Pint_06919 [Pistacia integerrima]|uniref:Uncharacterized protein n=1 Tax=Pistacia integerrima TaxID=434235 RepID=A0ACC0XWW5_9ROSI|nr:hypothetical protein Pint_06919 [Pistacia integerrima]